MVKVLITVAAIGLYLAIAIVALYVCLQRRKREELSRRL
jgi:hypothetical protein